MSRESAVPTSLGNVVRLSRYRYQRAETEDDDVLARLQYTGALEDFELILHLALVRKKHEAGYPSRAS